MPKKWLKVHIPCLFIFLKNDLVYDNNIFGSYVLLSFMITTQLEINLICMISCAVSPFVLQIFLISHAPKYFTIKTAEPLLFLKDFIQKTFNSYRKLKSTWKDIIDFNRLIIILIDSEKLGKELKRTRRMWEEKSFFSKTIFVNFLTQNWIHFLFIFTLNYKHILRCYF